MLETLVAVSVLLVGIVGPISLIVQALSSTSFSRNHIVAYNLAQEGIELMRAVRDDMALCTTLGAADFTNLGSLAPGYFKFDALLSTTISCGDANMNVPKPIQSIASTCNTPLFINGGYYTYTGGTPTNFSRCVRVCSPPDAAPCLAVSDSDIPGIDQIEIISTVSWEERGVTKNISLRNRLYNWK
ncbi:MAG: hypothetical protein Q8R30_01745 [bacterium]|nr:hypothetical protein [bacterium]MDZ4285352.1 hypothetical protein [Candidatus Sungbacteria bacterium]